MKVEKSLSPDVKFLQMFTKKEIIEAAIETLWVYTYALNDLEYALYKHKVVEIQKQSSEISHEIKNSTAISTKDIDQLIRLSNKCDKLHELLEKCYDRRYMSETH